MQDNHALKFLFVAVMLFVTFWTRSGSSDVSGTRAAATTKEEVVAPTVVNTIHVLAVPSTDQSALIEPVEQHATSTPLHSLAREAPPVFIEKAPAATSPSSVVRPRVYPKTNFDVRANTLLGFTYGRLSSFLIADLESGEEIYSQNALQRWPIASITKLMTAVVATQKIGVNATTTITQSAVDTFGDAGNLEVGQTFTVGDLLKALLEVSSNDAAAALAELYGRNEFMAAMNEKAREIGMSEATHFVDPIGLDSRNQSTPVDLQKLIAYIYDNEPHILRITREQEGRMKDLASGKFVRLQNINEFAGESGFLGGKTGFIDESGGNLVSLFSVAKRPILLVVLGSDNRFEITRQLLDWFTGNYAITSGN